MNAKDRAREIGMLLTHQGISQLLHRLITEHITQAVEEERKMFIGCVEDVRNEGYNDIDMVLEYFHEAIRERGKK